MIPAAGIGSRMQAGNFPKQYMSLCGTPILQRTIERLAALPQLAGIVVCLAAQDRFFQNLQLTTPVITATGGKERCHTVLNGLLALRGKANPQDWVLVHDAARPCVRLEDLKKLLQETSHHPVGGLLAAPVRDTMKRSNTDGEVVETISREQLWHALTPQVFRWQMLHDALQTVLSEQDLVTDEAQAIEYCGHRPKLVAGHLDNIKVTYPADLDTASLYLQQQQE